MGKLIALFIILVSFCLMLGLGACTKAQEEQKIMEKPKDTVEKATEPISETGKETEKEAIESRGENITENTMTTQEENLETPQTTTEGSALVEESSKSTTETVQDIEQEAAEPATMPETESFEKTPREKNIE